MAFAERYGPWALIAGASEGTGREFARQVAAQGLNCILVARRAGPLDALAETIRAESGVECVTAALDLAEPDAGERIAAAVGAREVGLYVANAGADPNGARFLDKPAAAWLDLVRRNVETTLACCHRFGTAMRARGRGGLLLVGSGACYGGGPALATYAGTKAFELCFAEGLWAELKTDGVDVLYLAMSITDTPELRRLLAEKGLPVPAQAADPAAVARLGLARLPHGPVANWGLGDGEAGFAGASAATRRARVETIAASSRAVLGK